MNEPYYKQSAESLNLWINLQKLSPVSVFMFFPICRLYINAIQHGSHLDGLQYTILK